MTTNILPFVIAWHICEDCQLHCGFCYRIKTGSPSLNSLDREKVVERIAQSGIRVVTLTGGEPLLHAEAVMSLLRCCRKHKLITKLDTNAALLTKDLISELEKCLHVIGIPLDGPEPIHDQLRQEGHFGAVMSSLSLLERSRLQVKVNTMVSRLNIHCISDIAEILRDRRISLWELYQFIPLGEGHTKKKTYAVSEREFYSAVRRVKETYPSLGKKISAVPCSLRKGSYFAIGQDGSLWTTPLTFNAGGVHRRLGSILENDLMGIWNSILIDKWKYKRKYTNQVRQLRLFDF